MPIRPSSVLSAFLLAAAVAASTPAMPHETSTPKPGITHPKLRDELLEMKVRDQAVRKAVPVNGEEWFKVDKANRERLKDIVREHGWPSVAMVGHEGASAAWLLAQHADLDPDFQKEVLRLMEPLVKTGQASGKDYAYLYDRTHWPQRYGTQGECTGPDSWAPREVEESEGLHARRRELGLIPMADYIAMFKEICKRHWKPEPARETKAVPAKAPAT
jgi:hypothetical protein